MSQASAIQVQRLSKVLIGPLVSEKTTRAGNQENSVTFWVNPKATKRDIKNAVEMYFPKAKVKQVRTLVVGRQFVKFGQTQGRTKKQKKAYVTLMPGNEIDFSEFES